MQYNTTQNLPLTGLPGFFISGVPDLELSRFDLALDDKLVPSPITLDLDFALFTFFFGVLLSDEDSSIVLELSIPFSIQSPTVSSVCLNYTVPCVENPSYDLFRSHCRSRFWGFRSSGSFWFRSCWGLRYRRSCIFRSNWSSCNGFRQTRRSTSATTIRYNIF